MQNLGDNNDDCPFSFNFDPETFKIGDIVSYRVPELFEDFPFIGTLEEVHEQHVLIAMNDPLNPGQLVKGTRESRPVVSAKEIPQAK